MKIKVFLKKNWNYLLLLLINPIIFMVAICTKGNIKQQQHYLVFLLSPSILIVYMIFAITMDKSSLSILESLGIIWFFSACILGFGSIPALITAMISGIVKTICRHYWQWILITTIIGAIISGSIFGLMYLEIKIFMDFAAIGGVCALISSCILWWFDKYRP